MGVFSANALEYAAHGLPVFPVDTRAKKPLVRGWQQADVTKTKRWVERFPNADGIGIVCGPGSGITEVDVDAVSPAHLAAAIERFGETPLVTLSASGKPKLWYGYNGEGRHIRPVPGLPLDVLGNGCTIAPPSYRADLGASYHFVKGSLDDLRRLPPIKANALEFPALYLGRPASEIHQGERNLVLWRFCMSEARSCDNVEALIECAQTFAAQMPDPLDTAEVERAARSAWRYQMNGLNFLGLKRPQVTKENAIMDELSDQPDAYYLRDLMERWHGDKTFAIAPTAVSCAGNPPWHYSRFKRACEILIQRGFLEVVSPPDRGRKNAGRYRLTGKIADSVNNHYTPFPPAPQP